MIASRLHVKELTACHLKFHDILCVMCSSVNLKSIVN